MKLSGLVFVFLFGPLLASAAPQKFDRCGVKAPSAAKIAKIEKDLAQWQLSQTGAVRDLEVKLRVWVIVKDEAVKLSQEKLDQQIDILKTSYADLRIKFDVLSVNQVVNQDVQNVRELFMTDPTLKKIAGGLRKNAVDILDVFIMQAPGKILGFANFPWDYKDNNDTDGVYVHIDTVPDGKAPYDEGKTLVHEVGHWFGLYHVFQNGCKGAGDMVADTPPQKSALFECQQSTSCGARTLDPIHNFMGYTDDRCLDEFTAGQIERAHQMYRRYRVKNGQG